MQADSIIDVYSPTTSLWVIFIYMHFIVIFRLQ